MFKSFILHMHYFCKERWVGLLPPATEHLNLSIWECMWRKGPSLVPVTRGNSITISLPLPYFTIWSNTLVQHSCKGSCCLNMQFIHFKAAVRRFILFSDICYVQMLACLRGNQWSLHRITPTQTVAACAIIVRLRRFASHIWDGDSKRRGKAS